MLTGMTHRVGAEGEVVIPKALREELSIEPGDEVIFWREDDHVAVRPVHPRPSLRGRFAGLDLSGAFEAERVSDHARRR